MSNAGHSTPGASTRPDDRTGAPSGWRPPEAGPAGGHEPYAARLFSWIRESGLTRGDDRWIGGVCGGLAAYLGWSPMLVRALMVGAVLVCGLGTVFYALAWFLLPDGRDGRILCEELSHGRWDWSCAGVLLCLVSTVIWPGVWVIGLCLGVLALWLTVWGAHRNAEAYRRPQPVAPAAYGRNDAFRHAAFAGSNPSGMPNPSGASTLSGMPDQPRMPDRFGSADGSGSPNRSDTTVRSAMPESSARPASAVYAVPTQAVGQASERTASSESASSESASPEPAPSASTPSGWSASPDAATGPAPAGPASAYGTPGPVPSGAASPGQASRGPAPSGHPVSAGQPMPGWSGATPFPPAPGAAPGASSAAVPPMMTSPYRPVAPQPKPKYVRRRPAGPIIVLAVVGAIFLSFAAMLMMWTDGNAPGDLESLLGDGLLWIGAVCVALGLLIVVLGCIGRRSGGLTPFAWIAAFLALTLAFLGVAYSVTYSRMLDDRDDYAYFDESGIPADLSVNGFDAIGSDPATMQRLADGLWVGGYGADDTLNIDLSKYGRDNGDHEMTRVDGAVATSSCPTGTIRLSVYRARVVVTIPDGCSWAYTNENDMWMNYDDQFGSRWSVVSWNGVWHDEMGMHFDDYDTGVYSTSPAPDVVDNAAGGYNWLTDQGSDNAPAMPELLIQPDTTVMGEIVVQYASQNDMPTHDEWAARTEDDHE